MTDYERIARAIAYIADRADRQPDLQDIAAQVNLSPFHFQRLFSRWAGITPKRFLQAVTMERSRRLLPASDSLLELTQAVGLSSGSRLHEHFVRLEAMTPGEYRSGGAGLAIDHGVHATPFGSMFVAITARGICRLSFLDTDADDEPLHEIRHQWPHARLRHDDGATRYVADVFMRLEHIDGPLSLHVAGTNFQIAVWRALLAIPFGSVVSYADIARALGRPSAARATGNAVAANPIAFLIPCHRVILGSGALGQYRWGPMRKRVMQVWERAQQQTAQQQTAQQQTAQQKPARGKSPGR